MATALLSGTASAQESAVTPAEQFATICGTKDTGIERLPGDDIAAADAPAFLRGDLERASSSRMVKIGDRYAMRAMMPSGFDPEHATLFKCALAYGGHTFDHEVSQLGALLSLAPQFGQTSAGLRLAQFSSGVTSFAMFEERDGWISIYKMDVLMTNIPKKYLKKGAKPATAPIVQ